MNHGTAQLVRLTSPWHNTLRTVNADSAFASVDTARRLKNECGLYFRGMVKTASAGFPKKFLKTAENYEGRGSSIHLKATVDGVDLMAVGWKDSTMLNLISSRGTTAAGRPVIKTLHRWIGEMRSERYKIEVARPQEMEDYFATSAAIDQHNHYRQGVIGLERSWKTRTWTRRAFSTLLGMIVTDAFLAYCYVRHEEEDMRSFVEPLAYALLQNMYKPRGVARPLTMESNVLPVCAFEVVNTHPLIVAKLNDMTPPSARKADVRRACTICQKKCSYYCKRCSSARKIVTVCALRADRSEPCINVHLREVIQGTHVQFN
jgi:hypothetical protein